MDIDTYSDPPVCPKKWRQLIKRLRRGAPCAVPVKVHRVKTSKSIYGDTSFIESPYPHYRIRINRYMGWEMSSSTLIHEWAHVIAHNPLIWTHGDTGVVKDHGPEWGVAFSKAYCASNCCD